MSSLTTWIFTKQKLLLIILIVPTICIVYYIRAAAMNDVMSCLVKYKEMNLNFKSIDPRTLEMIFQAKHKPHYNGKSIFFLETHIDANSKNKVVSLSTRQACSVEAAGKMIRKKSCERKANSKIYKFLLKTDR